LHSRNTIKIYDVTDALQYTLTNQICTCRSGLNEDTGFFSIQLPDKSGAYTDVTANWRVKIWLADGTVNASDPPTFAGKVSQNNTTLTMNGYIRVISGKGNGEILQRRIKTRQVYNSVHASDVATDLATELSIINADKIAVDTNHVTITVDADNYMDVFKKLSDYWVSAGAQVKKDYFVDNDNELMWLSRPIRTAITDASGTADAGGDASNTVDAARTEANDYWNGCYIKYLTGTNAGLTRLIIDFVAATDTLTHVAFPAVVDAGDTYTILGIEALTVGDNIKEYNVIRDFTQIKNNIVVYGRKVPFVGLNDATNKFQVYQIFGRKDPVAGDAYTDDAGWTTLLGTTTTETLTPSPQVGANYTQNTTGVVAGTYYSEFYRMFTTPISCEGYDGYGALEFWSMRLAMGGATVKLYCPDSSNYYSYAIPQLGDVDNTWKFHRFSLGMANVYNVTTNPDGQWVATGSPDWENISGIYFYAVTATGPGSYMGLDGLCFNFGRWRYTKTTAASITDYEQHDLTVVNDLLNSDAECEIHAETLTYQQKDPVVRVDVTIAGNTNMLVGDQIPLTIPAEAIAADNFYATSVEHNFDNIQKDGWKTKITLVDTLNTRNVPSATPQDALLKELKRQRDLGKGYLNKIS
jgi:hypothetical protein